MASFNRVILVGNLTRDPELRYIPSGMAVTEVGLAVNHRRKTAERRVDRRDDVRRRHAVGAHCRGRQRVPFQGCAGADRGPVETRFLGKRRQEVQ